MKNNAKQRKTWLSPNGKYRSNHPLYKLWMNIIQSCLNPNHQKYKYYGSKGITIVKEWLNFDRFVEDVGVKRDAFFKRINKLGNYAPDNVCWATRAGQFLYGINAFIENTLTQETDEFLFLLSDTIIILIVMSLLTIVVV